MNHAASIACVSLLLLAGGCGQSSRPADSETSSNQPVPMIDTRPMTPADRTGPGIRDSLSQKALAEGNSNTLTNINRMLDAAEAGNGRPTRWATSLEDVERRKREIARNNSVHNQELILGN